MSYSSGRFYTIRVGEHNRNVNEGTEKNIPGKRVIKHPLYNRPSAINNDIALIQLERPVKLNSRVGTVCLPSHNENVPTSARCFITGMSVKKIAPRLVLGVDTLLFSNWVLLFLTSPSKTDYYASNYAHL